jgi:RNA polymerase primary sigma factor
MRIIQLRYGLTGEEPLTLEETGKLLGITRERVRQIQEKATFKLRGLRELHELRS